MKLLVVDDLQNLRSLYKQIFLDKYEIFEAKNGLEAYDICLKEKPDLIICDFEMPIYNGAWLDNKLFEQGIKTPILLVTATQDAIFKQMRKQNTFKVIYKPFNVSELKKTIEEMKQTKYG